MVAGFIWRRKLQCGVSLPRLPAGCPSKEVRDLLTVMRAHPLRRDAEIIGEVREDPRYVPEMSTESGQGRIIDRLPGEPRPRILRDAY